MKALTGWPLPVAMALLFAVLIWNSEAQLGGAIAALVGLGLVLVLWAMFREMSFHAEITRALSVGDSAAAHRLIDAQLARRRASGVFSLYKAMAHELDGEWAKCLAVASAVRPEQLARAGRASWTLVAGCLRTGALCELGRSDEASATYAAEVEPRARELGPGNSLLAQLTFGRLRLARGELDGAKAALAPLARHIRLGESHRAMACFYLARAAELSGDAPAAKAARSQAPKLAGATYFAAAQGARAS